MGVYYFTALENRSPKEMCLKGWFFPGTVREGSVAGLSPCLYRWSVFSLNLLVYHLP